MFPILVVIFTGTFVTANEGVCPNHRSWASVAYPDNPCACRHSRIFGSLNNVAVFGSFAHLQVRDSPCMNASVQDPECILLPIQEALGKEQSTQWTEAYYQILTTLQLVLLVHTESVEILFSNGGGLLSFVRSRDETQCDFFASCVAGVTAQFVARDREGWGPVCTRLLSNESGFLLQSRHSADIRVDRMFEELYNQDRSVYDNVVIVTDLDGELCE